jgi:hypothetical protein
VHFYHLHTLDWVNPVNALKADPKETAKIQRLVSPHYPKSSPGYFRDVQTRIRKFVESGQLGPFKNGYWDNPAYKLPPEVDLMAVTHYLEALDMQKELVKVRTVFGGKNPHPNYLVGGVPCAINMDGDLAAGAPLNMERLNFVKARIDEMKTFNDQVYVPDVIAIASFYKDWLYGGGHGAHNVMDYGAYPKVNYDKSTDQLPGGVILNGNWDEVQEVGPLSRYTLAYAQGIDYVKEQVERSVAAFNRLAGTEVDARTALQSTIGRTLARSLEGQYCSDMMVDDWHQLIANIKAGDSFLFGYIRFAHFAAGYVLVIGLLFRISGPWSATATRASCSYRRCSAQATGAASGTKSNGMRSRPRSRANTPATTRWRRWRCTRCCCGARCHGHHRLGVVRRGRRHGLVAVRVVQLPCDSPVRPAPGRTHLAPPRNVVHPVLRDRPRVCRDPRGYHVAAVADQHHGQRLAHVQGQPGGR